MSAPQVDYWAESHFRAKPEREGRKRPGGFMFSPAEIMVSLGIHALVFMVVSFIPMGTPRKERARRVEVIQRMTPPEDVRIELPEIVESFKELSDMQLKVNDEPREGLSGEGEENDKMMEVSEDTIDIGEEAQVVESAGALVGDLLAKADGTYPKTPQIMGLDSKSGPALPHGYQNRKKSRRGAALARFGGKGSMEAVEKTLKWLAQHQETDGSWDATKYEGEAICRVAPTGVALLAFLGAGYCEQTAPYKGVVQRGIRFLNLQVNAAKQKPHFGNNYGSAIALMALAEASIFGSGSITKENADSIAQMFLDMYKGEGWNYDGGGFDFSVSGWVALGLKSAQSADLKAMNSPQARTVLDKYRNWVTTMTSNETGLGKYRPKEDTTTHMTWVGMFQRQFLDFPKNDPFLQKAAKNSEEWINGGTWVGGEKPGDVYGIYYGTLAAFQHQGFFWKSWNARMKKTLLASQREGDPKAMGGSWDPTAGNVAKQGGRVMTSALMCLCLEVYYRYELLN